MRGVATDPWADTVQTVALTFGAGAAFFAFRQAKLSRHGGGGANVMQLWTLIGADEARERRRILHRAVERAGPFDASAGNWTAQEIAAAEGVCQLWSVAGALAKHDLLPLDVVVDEWGGQIHRTWRDARALVEWQRGELHDPVRWSGFEWLANHVTNR